MQRLSCIQNKESTFHFIPLFSYNTSLPSFLVLVQVFFLFGWLVVLVLLGFFWEVGGERGGKGQNVRSSLISLWDT